MKTCAWCNFVISSDGEKAKKMIRRQDNLSHGICDECYKELKEHNEQFKQFKL
jgi:hypothetical protein